MQKGNCLDNRKKMGEKYFLNESGFFFIQMLLVFQQLEVLLAGFKTEVLFHFLGSTLACIYLNNAGV